MEEYSRQELTDQLVDLIVYLNRELHTGSLDEWRSLGMTIPQIKTLVVLQHKGPMRMGEIASFLGSTLSATTSIVDRLVDKQLIERDADPNDRRVVICKLTPEGEIGIAELWSIGRERAAEVVDRLNTEEIATLVSAFEMLRGVLDGINMPSSENRAQE